jgi:hypothetical protein
VFWLLPALPSHCKSAKHSRSLPRMWEPRKSAGSRLLSCGPAQALCRDGVAVLSAREQSSPGRDDHSSVVRLTQERLGKSPPLLKPVHHRSEFLSAPSLASTALQVLAGYSCASMEPSPLSIVRAQMSFLHSKTKAGTRPPTGRVSSPGH